MLIKLTLMISLYAIPLLGDIAEFDCFGVKKALLNQDFCSSTTPEQKKSE